MAKDKKKASANAEASSPEETKSTKKAKKSETKKNSEKKLNFFQKIGKWFHDLGVEFRHVTWPSWNTVSINTGVVLTVIVAGSVFIGLLDTGLLKLMQFLIGLSQ